MNHLLNANFTVLPAVRPFESDLERDLNAAASQPVSEPVVLGVREITGHAHNTMKRPICATIECHSCPFYKDRGSC